MENFRRARNLAQRNAAALTGFAELAAEAAGDAFCSHQGNCRRLRVGAVAEVPNCARAAAAISTSATARQGWFTVPISEAMNRPIPAMPAPRRAATSPSAIDCYAADREHRHAGGPHDVRETPDAEYG